MCANGSSCRYAEKNSQNFKIKGLGHRHLNGKLVQRVCPSEDKASLLRPGSMSRIWDDEVDFYMVKNIKNISIKNSNIDNDHSLSMWTRTG